MKAHDQAQAAQSYLDYTHRVEIGGYGSQDAGTLPKNRELTKEEKEVKEAALSALSLYFNSFPEDWPDKKEEKEKESKEDAQIKVS